MAEAYLEIESLVIKDVNGEYVSFAVNEVKK